MEKTKEINRHKELEDLLNKNEKGPKTLIKEDMIRMKGDPLGLRVPLDDEPSLDTHKNKAKKLDEVVVERYNPDVKIGLTTEDVETRQIAGMVNIADTGSTKSISSIITSNLFTLFNFLMFMITLWMITVKASLTNFFFVIIVSLNVTIGIIQEIRAKKTIDKLSLLSAPTAIVIRDKDELEISISDVVIDDILKLSSGKQITADSVIREGTIEVNESLLTGESDPVVKTEGDTLYSGSYVISGNCYAQVSAIGKDIYIQKLTSQAKKYKKPQSELLSSLKIIIRIIGGFIVPIAFGLFYLMTINGVLSYEEMVLKTSTAMIGMIPSGLFLLTSMALAVGVIRLAQNNTLVQELYCIETLARVDTLCLDKTGTITDGTMSVKSIIEFKTDSKLSLKNLISAMLNAQNDDNLTSQALKDRFGTAKSIRHKALIPFSSTRKYSAVQFDRYGTYILGAPEFVMKKNFSSVEQEVNKQSKEGYRVLIVGYSEGDIVDREIKGKIEPMALIMIEDTIRPDAIETINYFKEHNVEIKVISGDNPITVARIAERANVANADQYISLENMSDKEVVRIGNRYTVFGRVSPHQKKLLIESLKNNGHTVAMTGDGVNDILALKEADTSIAMASGSEAARNVSHLVLLDSNFSSMPKVVSEGRRVINNVEKVSTLYLTKTIFTLLLAIIGLFRNGDYPISSPSQMVLIEMFAIGIPSFFMALEQNNKQVKGRFLGNIIKAAIPGALIVVINSLIIFALSGPSALDMNTEVISTLIVSSATITSLTVLYRVSVPMNTLRSLLFFSMVVATLVAYFLIPVFDFVPFFYLDNSTATQLITLPQALLLLVLAQATFPMMYIVSHLYGWIKAGIAHIINKIADID
ncbi:MAG: HAD-IC family P-type ATPase [Acholeplasmataceae bacterium]